MGGAQGWVGRMELWFGGLGVGRLGLGSELDGYAVLILTIKRGGDATQ